MQTFSPRKVPPDSWRGWLREALGLATRRAVFGTAVTLGVLAPFWSGSSWLKVLGLPPLTGALLGVMCVLAHCTDRRLAFWASLHDSVPGVLRLAGLSLGVMVAAAAILLPYYWLNTWLGVPLIDEHAVRVSGPIIGEARFVAGEIATFWLGGLLVAIPFLIFFAPLLVCARLPAGAAARLAIDGLVMNRHVIWLNAAAMLLGYGLSRLHGLSCIVLFPVTGALSYVAYRHVYEGAAPRREEAALATHTVALPEPPAA